MDSRLPTGTGPQAVADPSAAVGAEAALSVALPAHEAAFPSAREQDSVAGAWLGLGRPWQLGLAVLGVLTLVRLYILNGFDLMPQSTYYAFYAAHPSLSYFDHPPMVALMIRAGTALFGWSATGVRLSAFVTTLLIQLAFLDVARQLLPRARQATAWTLLVAAPIITVLGLMAYPDTPLVLFWMLSLGALARAVFGGHRVWWIVAGILMGLAFDSKYPAVFLQLGMGLFLVLSPQHRRFLKTPWPYLALVAAHLTMLPVYIWNLRHGMASFSFQSVDRTTEMGGFALRNIIGFLAVQSFLVQQVMFVVLLGLVWRYGRRLLAGRVISTRVLFVLAFFLPMVAVHLGLTLIMWVKLNWVVPAWLTGILLGALTVSRAKLPRHLLASGLVHAALVIVLVLWPVPITGDDTWYGWSELGTRVGALAEQHPEAFVFSADSYKLTSEMMFYAERKIYSRNVIGLRGFHFDFVDDPRTLAGKDALLIRSEPKLHHSQRTDAILDRAGRFFPGGVEEIEPIILEHHGKPVRMFRVFYCRDYQPLDAAALEALGPGW